MIEYMCVNVCVLVDRRFCVARTLIYSSLNCYRRRHHHRGCVFVSVACKEFCWRVREGDILLLGAAVATIGGIIHSHLFIRFLFVLDATESQQSSSSLSFGFGGKYSSCASHSVI